MTQETIQRLLSTDTPKWERVQITAREMTRNNLTAEIYSQAEIGSRAPALLLKALIDMNRLIDALQRPENCRLSHDRKKEEIENSVKVELDMAIASASALANRGIKIQGLIDSLLKEIEELPPP